MTNSTSEFILAIITPNFDSMIEFFKTLELVVKNSEGDPLSPLFSQQRSVTIWQDNKLVFNLEENTSIKPSASLNLLLFGDNYTTEKLEAICVKLSQRDFDNGVDGTYYTFITPDGGKVAIKADDSHGFFQ